MLARFKGNQEDFKTKLMGIKNNHKYFIEFEEKSFWKHLLTKKETVFLKVKTNRGVFSIPYLKKSLVFENWKILKF